MTTFIQCHHCQEDMNSADWLANGQRCLHCDSPLSSTWALPSPKHMPLTSLRNRLTLATQLNLRSKPAYV